MTQDAAHSSLFRTSDFLILAALVAGGLLELMLPLRFPDVAPGVWDGALRIGAGVFLCAWGAVRVGRVRRALQAAGQAPGPGKASTALVTDGVFRRSRNPMYAGVVAVYAGLGLVLGAGWLVILTPALVAAFTVVLIRPEEEYLRRTFGDAYEDWARKARRWG